MVPKRLQSDHRTLHAELYGDRLAIFEKKFIREVKIPQILSLEGRLVSVVPKDDTSSLIKLSKTILNIDQEKIPDYLKSILKDSIRLEEIGMKIASKPKHKFTDSVSIFLISVAIIFVGIPVALLLIIATITMIFYITCELGNFILQLIS